MKHLDIPYEDIPYESFQKRRRDGELAAPELDSVNRRLYALPSQLVGREKFWAEHDAAEPVSPVRFRYGRKGQR